MPVSNLVRSLKRQLSYVHIEGDNDSKHSMDSPVMSVNEDKNDEEVFDDSIVDTTNTSVINKQGVLVRQSSVLFIHKQNYS